MIFGLVCFIVTGLVLFWIRDPLEYAEHSQQWGWVLKRNVLGFWITAGYLSREKNRLAAKEKKLKAQLKKTSKQYEDAVKALDDRVNVVNGRFASHLRELDGGRHWKYLFRKAPPLDPQFAKDLEKYNKSKKMTKTVSHYVIQEINLKERERLGINPSDPVILFRNPTRDQNQNNRNQNRKKGGGNQNNGNNANH